MKIKRIKIPKNRNFTPILKQINKYSYYLIKYESRWITSKIFEAGWINSQCDTEESKKKALKNPHSWEFDYGSFHMSFNSSGANNTIDKNFKEIWEIDDPSLMRKEAKLLLHGRTYNDDTDTVTGPVTGPMTGPANLFEELDVIFKR